MMTKPFLLAVGDRFTIERDPSETVYTRVDSGDTSWSADIDAVSDDHKLIRLTGTVNVTPIARPEFRI